MIKHDFDFDPTCGYSKKDLLAMTPPDTEPDDFVEFWENTYARAMNISSEIKMREICSPEPDAKCYEVRFKSLGGLEIGAWLSRPVKSGGGIVVGHGYGGIPTPVLVKDFTVITPCSRGFNLSNCLEIPWWASGHVITGVESRETYVLRGAVADIWRAASVMLELFPDTKSNLNYSGGSYGGGLGALAAAWEKRFKSAYLNVPTFGHHPSRLKFKCTGSGEAVRQYWKEHPEVTDVLAYFDAATAAEYITIPTLCTPALFDPCVLPPGQFAVNNAIPEEFRQTVILLCGHYSTPENDEILKEVETLKTKLFSRPA
jgi:cephalosporin-C deacetylase